MFSAVCAVCTALPLRNLGWAGLPWEQNRNQENEGHRRNIEIRSERRESTFGWLFLEPGIKMELSIRQPLSFYRLGAENKVNSHASKGAHAFLLPQALFHCKRTCVTMEI